MLDQVWDIELTLTPRWGMGFRMLLGREAVRHRFLIDSGRSFLGEQPEIEGLYACGNCSAPTLPCYPGPGSTLGPSMTFGYQAAKAISGYQD